MSKVLTREQLGASVHAALVRSGIPVALAEKCARISVQAVWEVCEGRSHYFAMGARKLLIRRNAQIFGSFDGSNHAELAERFRVSIRHVERIVSQQLRIQRNTEGGR